MMEEQLYETKKKKHYLYSADVLQLDHLMQNYIKLHYFNMTVQWYIIHARYFVKLSLV